MTVSDDGVAEIPLEGDAQLTARDDRADDGPVRLDAAAGPGDREHPGLDRRRAGAAPGRRHDVPRRRRRRVRPGRLPVQPAALRAARRHGRRPAPRPALAPVDRAARLAQPRPPSRSASASTRPRSPASAPTARRCSSATSAAPSRIGCAPSSTAPPTCCGRRGTSPTGSGWSTGPRPGRGSCYLQRDRVAELRVPGLTGTGSARSWSRATAPGWSRSCGAPAGDVLVVSRIQHSATGRVLGATRRRADRRRRRRRPADPGHRAGRSPERVAMLVPLDADLARSRRCRSTARRPAGDAATVTARRPAALARRVARHRRAAVRPGAAAHLVDVASQQLDRRSTRGIDDPRLRRLIHRPPRRRVEPARAGLVASGMLRDVLDGAVDLLLGGACVGCARPGRRAVPGLRRRCCRPTRGPAWPDPVPAGPGAALGGGGVRRHACARCSSRTRSTGCWRCAARSPRLLADAVAAAARRGRRPARWCWCRCRRAPASPGPAATTRRPR